MNVNDGGPAFPLVAHEDWQEMHDGMLLRDYFAAKAMAGMVSTSAAPCLAGLDGMEQYTAEAAYRMADAMLRARGAQ